MNPMQKRTMRGLVVFATMIFLALLYLLHVEILGLQGEDSTISALIWGLWAREPWVVLIIVLTFVAIFMFLLGHFTAQRSTVYEQIRQEDEQRRRRLSQSPVPGLSGSELPSPNLHYSDGKDRKGGRK